MYILKLIQGIHTMYVFKTNKIYNTVTDKLKHYLFCSEVMEIKMSALGTTECTTPVILLDVTNYTDTYVFFSKFKPL